MLNFFLIHSHLDLRHSCSVFVPYVLQPAAISGGVPELQPQLPQRAGGALQQLPGLRGLHRGPTHPEEAEGAG